MTLAEIATAIIGVLNLVGIFLIPHFRSLFRDVNYLKENNVKLKGTIERVDLKVEHIENNYKAGIEYVRETMDRLEASNNAGLQRLESNIVELKTEIRELFQRRRSDD